jgi:DNA-binding NarL/FixJ family response regulator
MSDPIRVLIADDHTLFREGLSAILSVAADTDVVGEAANGEEAIAQAIALSPDVILMDIMMPSINGIDATRRILEHKPEIGIIVLTMLEDDDSVFAAMCAGARGYILKGADKAEVLRTIRAVSGGEALFGPKIAERLTRFFNNVAQVQRESGKSNSFTDLTDREREVLELIAQGSNNQEIAGRLFIAPKTVSNHISNIFSKLQVSDRAQAIVKARQAGMGNEPEIQHNS